MRRGSERAGSPFYDAARTGCAPYRGGIRRAQQVAPLPRERYLLATDGDPGVAATGKMPVVPVWGIII